MSSDFSPTESSSSKNGTHFHSHQSQHAASDANIRNFAPVARIMKTALPDNAKIAKEAKECMQECVSEFISFITSEASEKCQQEKRKTVNGEDILFAMTSLGFENYAEALKIYLSKYRETQSSRTDNQNRPTSSGGFPSGGPVGGASSNTTTGTFVGNQQNTTSPTQGLDTGDQDATGAYYTGLAPGHNGIGGDGY
ncbi:transcriptional activator hap3 [Lithohypha guttulata]|uniref:Transcriptional activator hap3 n=1 Tax=Lithohypha guttulata TaxID=1690604 RepID=A0AAN7SXL4_9EURO|nr:transcriptional activator hap3 [Lithohypha guttulata]KAK5084317.1 transcriptional activator hap3 [Lithohypha guttulata]KAK5106132.1 transcriptional activator hap3 [Lithohypha guttulata]